MIDPTFRNINGLFVLSFRNPKNDLERDSQDRYYMESVAMKDFSALINNSRLFFRFINCNRIIKTMKCQKVLNLLNEADDSKFVTRNWNIVNDHSNIIYDAGNKIIYNRELLKSNLYDYNNACILVMGISLLQDIMEINSI